MLDKDMVVYVLSYDAPHRKTQDLLFRLKIKGYNNVVVVATPWVERNNFDPLIPHRKFNVLNTSLSDLCSSLNYKITMLDNKDLYDYFKSNRAGVVLIGGSGILSKDLADSGNIINSHPAYLPYVRGLDSLKWTIYHNKPIGVTTHFISNECDAGRLIRRELVPLYSWDTFHSVANRQYEMEVDMLVDSLQDISTASLEELSTQESSVMRRMPHSNEMRLMKRFQKIIDNVEVIK